MSRRPGIGVPFLEKHYEKIRSDGKIYLPGGQVSFLPRSWEKYFDDDYISNMKKERFEKQLLNDRYVKSVQGNTLEDIITDISKRKYENLRKVLTRPL